MIIKNTISIDELVELHEKIFPDYFLTALGKQLLSRYYSHFVNNQENHIIGVYIDDKLVGFGLFLLDYNKQMKFFLRKYWLYISKHILWKFITLDKTVISSTFARLKNYFIGPKSMESKIELPLLTLLSIGVTPEHQGKGISKLILKAGEDFYKNREGIYLSVKPDNNVAINAYKAAGFQTILCEKNKIVMVKSL